MKIKLMVFFCFLTGNTFGQDCPEKVSVDGYFIASVEDVILKPYAVRKRNITTYKIPIDVRKSWMFLPKDSITAAKPWSYWFTHFDPEHMGVYGTSFLYTQRQLKKYNCPLQVDTTSLRFSTNEYFYRPKGMKGHVFALYYIEADWVKVTIDKKSPDGSRGYDEVSRSAVPEVGDTYLLHAMYHLKKLDQKPVINDPNVEKIARKN